MNAFLPPVRTFAIYYVTVEREHNRIRRRTLQLLQKKNMQLAWMPHTVKISVYLRLLCGNFSEHSAAGLNHSPALAHGTLHNFPQYTDLVKAFGKLPLPLRGLLCNTAVTVAHHTQSFLLCSSLSNSLFRKIKALRIDTAVGLSGFTSIIYKSLQK